MRIDFSQCHRNAAHKSFVSRLVSYKYQRAIAGLVMARSAPWSLDVREHEFNDTEALRRAICETSSLESLNSLSLRDDADRNISQILHRDRSLLLPLVLASALAVSHPSQALSLVVSCNRSPAKQAKQPGNWVLDNSNAS